MSLENHLSTILGIVEPPRVAAARKISDSVPPRPDALYEYCVRVSRPEYGSIFITAASEDAARQDCDFGDIDWDDCGDVDIDDVDQQSHEPANQDDLDEWDDQYAHKYDTDGDPKCSNCEDNYPVAELTTDPNDPYRWYCSDCDSKHPSLPDAL